MQSLPPNWHQAQPQPGRSSGQRIDQVCRCHRIATVMRAHSSVTDHGTARPGSARHSAGGGIGQRISAMGYNKPRQSDHGMRGMVVGRYAASPRRGLADRSRRSSASTSTVSADEHWQPKASRASSTHARARGANPSRGLAMPICATGMDPIISPC